MKKKNKIKQSDYNRILITETLPYETPIIFSNDGLYQRISSIDTADEIQKTITKILILGEGNSRPIHSTNPYLYKIRKNSVEFRRLALLHPLSQWKAKCFYQKYEKLILHYCSKSPASIRSPKNVAGSFFSKSSWENVNQYKYKSGTVSLSASDRYVKHAPSFFSYRGYDRLYKFFNSKDYFSLEKNFSVLTTLDVSKCFDSIYTHCLSWAVKDKAFTKENVSVSSTFAQEFDQIIRHGNHNETNGIPIGPEFSRIFAEILFQEIDQRAIGRLKKFHFGKDYTFRRYVDDVFIFSEDESIARQVYEVYSDVLISFNLHANTAKSATFYRPFLTTKSRLIFEAGKGANEFFEKFLEDDGRGSLIPKSIFRSWKLTKSYIDSIKALCSSGEASYDEIASFLISVITERIKKLVNNQIEEDEVEKVANLYMRAMEVLLDVLFFLYSVAPSVGASYKLSTSVILIFRFVKCHLPEQVPTISQMLYDLVSALLLSQSGRSHGDGVESFIHLECLNIILATHELGTVYLLPQKVLNDLFIKDKTLTYFTVVSCLFYIRDDPQYNDLRTALINIVSIKLSDLSDVFINSEKAYLFLDMLSCPFIPDKAKSSWIRAFYAAANQSPPTAANLANFLKDAASLHWQVDWNEVDLLNSLEKKELKQAY